MGICTHTTISQIWSMAGLCDNCWWRPFPVTSIAPIRSYAWVVQSDIHQGVGLPTSERRCKRKASDKSSVSKDQGLAVYFNTATMQKQVSTSSTTAMLQEALEREQESAGATQESTAHAMLEPETTATVTITGLPVSASHTKIPIREEFRCRRLWFFYHDLRAFTTSVSAPCIMRFCVNSKGGCTIGMSDSEYLYAHKSSCRFYYLAPLIVCILLVCILERFVDDLRCVRACMWPISWSPRGMTRCNLHLCC